MWQVHYTTPAPTQPQTLASSPQAAVRVGRQPSNVTGGRGGQAGPEQDRKNGANATWHL